MLYLFLFLAGHILVVLVLVFLLVVVLLLLDIEVFVGPFLMFFEDVGEVIEILAGEDVLVF